MAFWPTLKQHLQSWTLRSGTSRPPVLPDMRNPGVVIKILIILAGLCAGLALFVAQSAHEWAGLMFSYFFFIFPPSLMVIVALMLVQPRLAKPHTKWLEPFAYLLAIAAANVFYFALNAPERRLFSLSHDGFMVLKISLITASVMSILFMFLYFVSLSLLPASAEIRLQSLTYRIRPHFLFNSLNAILALIRRDTRKAEYALEELAELFRWLLKDVAQFITLRQEIDIVQQFLAIEKVRLGDRLNIEWSIAPQAQNAIIPALTLQPLVENAIYHGAESMSAPCPIKVVITHDVGLISVRVTNPYDPNFHRKKGSGIALDTIKQRLELCFDLEFRVSTSTQNNIYAIELSFPYRTHIPS